MSIKPRVPTINGNNPLTKDLVFDAALWERGSTSSRELVGKLQGTIASSGATWSVERSGAGLDFSAAASRVAFVTGTKLNSPTVFSAEFLMLVRGSGGSSLGRIAQKGPGASGSWFILADSTTVQLNIGYSTINLSRAATHLGLNVFQEVVITYDNSNTVAGIRIYINGAEASYSTSAVSSGTRNADDTNLYLGNRADSLRNLNGKIIYLRYWNRLLASSEIQQLALNPWSFYPQPGLVTNLR